MTTTAPATASSTASIALDQLQDALNHILIETGSVFADPGSYKTSTIVETNLQLKLALPRAVDSFHSALDTLEEEIMLAKAVLRRELQSLRSRDADGSAVADAVTNPSAFASSIPSAHSEDKQMQPVVTAPEANAVDISNGIRVDESMPDRPAAESTETPAISEAPVEAKTVGESVAAVPEPTEDKKPGEDLTQPTASEAAGPGSANATTTNDASIAEDKDAKDSRELDSIMQDLQNSTQDGQDADNAFTASDVGSLLPGLENYANEGGPADFSGLGDFGDFGATADHLAGNDGGADGAGATDDFMQGANTNFDDLFSYGEFDVNGDEGTADEQGLLDGTEFDENFFNLDQAS